MACRTLYCSTILSAWLATHNLARLANTVVRCGTVRPGAASSAAVLRYKSQHAVQAMVLKMPRRISTCLASKITTQPVF